MIKAAILYGRVSTDIQLEHGYSLPMQMRAMRSYAEENGFRVVGEFQDDCSGSIPFKNRPKGALLYERIAQGDIDAVIIYELDRASRDKYTMPIEFMVFRRDLEEAGVDLHFVDSGKSDGGLLDMVKAWQAGEERRKIRERTMRGRRGKIESGRLPGNGPRCYGYRVVGERKDTELVVDDEEAEIIRLIFQWYVYGNGNGMPLGVLEIADKLTAMEIPSYGDKHTKGKKRGYGVWTPGQVYPILKRETYTGTWYAYRYKSVNGKRVRRPREEWIGVPVPPIIDEDIWKLAQKKLATGRRMSTRNNLKHQYLMGRLLSCTCGYRIQGKPCWTRHKTVYLYYRCNGRDRSITAGTCSLPNFRAEQVDEVVWDWVESILLDPEMIRQGFKDAQDETEQVNQSLYDRLETIEKLIDQNDVKLNRLLELYLSGDFDRELLVEKQTQLEQICSDLEEERDDLLGRLEQNVITDDQIRSVEEFAGKVRSKLGDNIDFASKRRIIELMNVTGKLAVEDGEKIIYIQCMIGGERLSVNSGKDCNCPCQNLLW